MSSQDHSENKTEMRQIGYESAKGKYFVITIFVILTFLVTIFLVLDITLLVLYAKDGKSETEMVKMSSISFYECESLDDECNLGSSEGKIWIPLQEDSKIDGFFSPPLANNEDFWFSSGVEGISQAKIFFKGDNHHHNLNDFVTHQVGGFLDKLTFFVPDKKEYRCEFICRNENTGVEKEVDVELFARGDKIAHVLCFSLGNSVCWNMDGYTAFPKNVKASRQIGKVDDNLPSEEEEKNLEE